MSVFGAIRGLRFLAMQVWDAGQLLFNPGPAFFDPKRSAADQDATSSVFGAAGRSAGQAFVTKVDHGSGAEPPETPSAVHARQVRANRDHPGK